MSTLAWTMILIFATLFKRKKKKIKLLEDFLRLYCWYASLQFSFWSPQSCFSLLSLVHVHFSAHNSWMTTFLLLNKWTDCVRDSRCEILIAVSLKYHYNNPLNIFSRGTNNSVHAISEHVCRISFTYIIHTHIYIQYIYIFSLSLYISKKFSPWHSERSA